jgi:tetratricopeptide (TPR) repeat protein
MESPDTVIMELVDLALGEILVHEDPDRFLAWARQSLPPHLEPMLPDVPADGVRALAIHFGRNIWNCTPLPSNGFRPRPLPAPERNQPCMCGSGRKYKHCCADAPPMPTFQADEIWSLMVGHLDRQALAKALAGRRIPASALAEVALGELRDGRPRRALRLLEPIFDDSLESLDLRYGPALNVLCDTYNELGWTRKKMAFLQRVAAEASDRLAGEAWQRLCSHYMDRRDYPQAWVAFQGAQNCDPLDVSLSMLEIQLLVCDAKLQQAKQRARFWRAQLERIGETEGVISELLEAACHDPVAALADLYLTMSHSEAVELRRWLEDCHGRPLPDYRIAEPEVMDSPDPERLRADLRARLRRMGAPLQDVGRQIEEIVAQLKTGSSAEEQPATEDTTATGGPPEDEESGLTLQPPAPVRELEEAWHKIYPVGKPFSVSLAAAHDRDPWEETSAPRWLRFLRDHPEAFSSLDILDDLAGAVSALDLSGVVWVDRALYEPILDRGAAIVEQAVSGDPQARLLWSWTDNRPGLRLIARAIYHWQDSDERQKAAHMTELLLRLNPGDNHGLRRPVMNDLLREGKDEQALALAAQYPDDLSPEISYGPVLALYRLGRLPEAAAALRQAQQDLPLVPRYLILPRPRKPRFDPVGIQIGGPDQAWLYREEMREVWRAAPGLLEWLRQESGAEERRRDP